MFVVVEGPEGAGKSSLVRWLATRLLADGREVVTVREPGGTPIAEAARRLALRSKHDLPPAAELFLVLAARADLVARVIRPALDAGRMVVADRFDLSTLAYQVAGRGLPRADVAAAVRLATGGLAPDLTLVLDVPVEVGLERRRRTGMAADRFEREEGAFHRRVRDAYREARGPGIVHVDGSRPKAVVQETAWREVQAATTDSLRGVT